MNGAPNILIESHRLSIVPFSALDADEAFPCITQTLTRLMSWEPPKDRAEFDRVWQSWLPTIIDRTDLVFTIRERGSMAFLGLAGLHRAKSESPELGIWIREDRHGEGFGREAVKWVARWASAALNSSEFTYPVAEENRGSRRIAESLGGVIVECYDTSKYRCVVYRIPRQTTADNA
ncbi:GNAT family N-acetyltransferase [Burkholderia metallica]|uniref:GNAT family N-acetyltransferase n=1 Tax=Burkholderia metallica TaxID=488729 RepID=UPI0015832156|nr:GNAT family N-acetyltransferase [Burkholderia metallica]